MEFRLNGELKQYNGDPELPLLTVTRKVTLIPG